LGLRWRDISVVKGEREELKMINRALFIPTTHNSNEIF